MAFSNFYTRPGPGVRKDEPRKKGVARFFELLGRDFTSYWRAAMLSSLAFVPAAACAFFAVDTGALVFVLLGGLLGGLGGPCMAGLYDTILRTLRDEPGYWWHVYKKAVKRNAKASVLPGMVSSLLLCLELYSAGLFLNMSEPAPMVGLCLLLSTFFIMALLALYWAQLVLLELPALTLLRNSLLLFFGMLPRALGAAAWQFLYWGLMLLFLPATVPLYLLTSSWLPALLSCLTLYAGLDKTFAIEAKLAEQRREAEEAELPPAPEAAAETGETIGSDA